jgi:putative heme-binding domain-containing protein
LFFSPALNCAKCHKVGDKGAAVGPDLTAIGKSRPRADLLESMLEPSRRIEPKFAAYVISMLDGRTATGVIARRDEKEVVLLDAEGKEVVIVSKNLEEMKPSRISLMPAGQLAGLTAQEAADLVEFLASRK